MAVVATYTYDPTSDEKRKANIDAHRAFVDTLGDKAKVLAAGRIDGAPFNIMFLFDGVTPDEVKAILGQDPFNKLGFITAINAYVWEPQRGELAPL